MDGCLGEYSGRVNIVPLMFAEQVRLACLAEKMLSQAEIYALVDYCDVLLAKLNSRRRKKYVVIRNKKFVKMLCGRWRLPSYKLGDRVYRFKSYWPVIELVQWQKDKSLCDISYDSVTEGAYRRPDMINYMVSLNGVGVAKTCLTDKDGVEIDVAMNGSRVLVWNGEHVILQEVRSPVDNTQLYMHVLYEEVDMAAAAE